MATSMFGVGETFYVESPIKTISGRYIESSNKYDMTTSATHDNNAGIYQLGRTIKRTPELG